MRARFVFLLAVLLLGGCGQPDVTQQGPTAAATRPPYPVATELPYLGSVDRSSAEATPDMYPAPLSAEQIARLQAVNLPTCPAPTATPVATATPPPTATAVPPGSPTWTPVPTPSPASLPGDFKLALSACALQDGGAHVMFNATLTGGSDNSYEFYCPNPDWQFGDGSGEMAFVDCWSWSPDIRIQRTFTTDYTYKRPGTYRARLQIESRGGTLESNTVTIEVR